MARQGHPGLARRSSRPSDRWQMRFWRGVASKLSWSEAVAYQFFVRTRFRRVPSPLAGS
jgi:hypothetical protein